MSRLTELRCNWQGFAGFSSPCGELLRVQLGPWPAYKHARQLGWAFVHDERLDAQALNMLDPERPRLLVLCIAHAQRWRQWLGERYELAAARAVALIREHNEGKQQSMFSDERDGRARGGLHRGE